MDLYWFCVGMLVGAIGIEQLKKYEKRLALVEHATAPELPPAKSWEEVADENLRAFAREIVAGLVDAGVFAMTPTPVAAQG